MIKSILPSQRQIIYLEHCKIVVNDFMLTYIKKSDSNFNIYNIPYANCATLLLGPGTSISQQASFLLSKEGVFVAFTGSAGTPIYFASQSEYREPKHFQFWIKFWSDEQKRLQVAKYFQLKRIEFLQKSWSELFSKYYDEKLQEICLNFKNRINNSSNITILMGNEGIFAKNLYKILAQDYYDKGKKFSRKPQVKEDDVNELLDSNNYLAYGISACVLWNLGLSFSLPVTHGQTRRGGLVFDVADIIKDACIMPFCFLGAKNNSSYKSVKVDCLDWIEKMEALKYLFKIITNITNQKDENIILC